MEMHSKSNVETVLAFDFGLKQIGIAFGQTITNQSTGIPNWDEIKTIVEEWNPNTLVVGLPINMDDSESDMSKLTRTFAKGLKDRIHKSVKLMDERLSSREAKNEVKEVFKNFDATKADHIAASFILQSYLNDPKLAENC